MYELNKNYWYFYNKICVARVSSSAKAVYKTLLQYASRETWSCFPSIKRIAKDTSLSERTVQRQLRILEKEKYILRISRKKESNGYTSNIYFLN